MRDEKREVVQEKESYFGEEAETRSKLGKPTVEWEKKSLGIFEGQSYAITTEQKQVT